MEKFEVGKVYACDLMNLCINDCEDDYNGLFDDIKVEIKYYPYRCGHYYTLLKCISTGDETMFIEYKTSTKIISNNDNYPKTYLVNKETFYKVKKEILNRPLLYINYFDVLEINDEVLKKFVCDMNNDALDLNKAIAKSRNNLYEGWNDALVTLIRQNQRMAEAENIIRDFENKPKTLKKEYTC